MTSDPILETKVCVAIAVPQEREKIIRTENKWEETYQEKAKSIYKSSHSGIRKA